MAAFGPQIVYPVLIPWVGSHTALVWVLPDNRPSAPHPRPTPSTNTYTHIKSDSLAKGYLTVPFRLGYHPEVRDPDGDFHHLKFFSNALTEVI